MKNISFNFSPQAFKRSFVNFLHRFHITLFVIIIFGGLAVVVLLLNSIIIRSGESNGYTSDTNNTSFDQATIKRIQELKTSSQSGTPLPTNVRTNPFVE